MLLRDMRWALATAGALMFFSACNATGSLAPPSGAHSGASIVTHADAHPDDNKSILKLLTKDVTIGSTVDATNGDEGPRAAAIVRTNYGELKKGDILVCNFEDSSGTAGNGTTVELFKPVASSKPTTFVQSSDIKGCDGDAVTMGNSVYACGLNGTCDSFNQKGSKVKAYSITAPLGDADAPPLYDYSPEYIFIGKADTGAIDSISLGAYGTGKVLETVAGFDVNGGSGWNAFGPGGLAYYCGGVRGSFCKSAKIDVLYVADAACNAVVAIDHASNLLVKDEITVQSGCKSFKCLYPKTTCGRVVKSGSPLNSPVAETVLPNGNLIVANAADNKLIEMTPKGKVLDSEVIDNGNAGAVYGLAAGGSKDSNTVLFYTDVNTNTLHELEQ